MKFSKRTLWLLLPAILLIAFDQWTKYLAVVHLKDQESIRLIEGVFHLTYTENTGAAFSLLEGKQVFFTLVTVMVLLILGYIWYRMPSGKRFIPIQVVMVLLISGAIGNLIDRIRQNYVVDFLNFILIHFPIFNVADCYVTVSCVIFILLFLVYYKDEDIETIERQLKPKRREK
ncbi:MAG: signal peptidase II [Lachnospiraceae bacterium]